MSLEPGARASLPVWQLKAGDDSFVGAFWYQALRMACGNPRNPLLRVCHDVGESLGRDAEQSHRLGGWVRERVQAIRAFGEVDNVSGRELLLALRRANGWRSAKHEEHLFDAVVHV